VHARYHQVVAFLGDGDEVEAQGVGGSLDTHPAVGRPGLDGHGHGQVGVFLAGVALDVTGRDAQ
jgi:hypothetical protein